MEWRGRWRRGNIAPSPRESAGNCAHPTRDTCLRDRGLEKMGRRGSHKSGLTGRAQGTYLNSLDNASREYWNINLSGLFFSGLLAIIKFNNRDIGNDQCQY